MANKLGTKLKVEKVESKSPRPKAANKKAKEKETDRTAVEEHMGFVSASEFNTLCAAVEVLTTRVQRQREAIEDLCGIVLDLEDTSFWQKLKGILLHRFRRGKYTSRFR